MDGIKLKFTAMY